VDFRIGADRRRPSTGGCREGWTAGTERSIGLGLRAVVVRFGVGTAGLPAVVGVGVITVVVGAAVPPGSASGKVQPE
jgi:hypothetical protein